MKNAMAFARLVIRMRTAAKIIVEKLATKQNLRGAALAVSPSMGR
jgi:hypothetical protein